MKIEAVIFDLDGTITQPYFDFDAIRKELGLDPNTGPLLEAMGKMTPSQREHAERVLHNHEQMAVAESTLNPGTRQTLRELRKAGIKIGILTRNKKDNALAVAQKHRLKFDAVVGREDGPVKPDAFGVLHLCKLFGTTPVNTLMVGDYLFDLLCAKAAGAIPVWLANNDLADDFTRHADYTIENINQVLQIIEKKKGH